MPINAIDADAVQDVWDVGDTPAAPVATSPLHLAALDWAGRGVAVFPCRPGTKRPATQNGYLSATTDLAQINAWWTEDPSYNPAIVPASADLVVIDADTDYRRDGAKAGEAAWRQLQQGNEAAPATYAQETPSGGRHFIFGGGVIPSSTAALAPFLDVKSSTGYVLVAPAVIDERDERGARYASKRGVYGIASNLWPPAPLPSWARALATKMGTPAPSSRRGEPTCLANLKAALEHVTIRGDYEAWRDIMFACRSADVTDADEAAVYEALDAWSATQPGYDADQNRSLWETAKADDPSRPMIGVGTLYKLARANGYVGRTDTVATATALNTVFGDAVAHLTASEEADGVAEPSDDDSELTYEGLGDLLASDPQPVAELVPNLVEKGIFTTLAGKGGTNKSRLGLQWGLCIATGTPIMGRNVVRTPFWFLSCEDPREEIVRRVHDITKRLQIPGNAAHDALRYFNRRGKRSPLIIVRDTEDDEPVVLTPFGKKFVAALHAAPGHKFLLIDSTYNAARFLGKAKISETAVQECIGWFDALCASADCTILSLWHPSQAGSERDDGSGWSVAWHNTPRARLYIEPVKDRDDVFELSCKKRNHGRKWPPITLHWRDGALLPRTDVAEADMHARFNQTCVDAAITAAEGGQPIQKQAHIASWVLDEIEAACGYRPSQRDVKEALAAAIPAQQLRYWTNKKGGSGYYPWDVERLQELALEAAERRTEARKARKRPA